MNKRMRELQALITSKTAEAKGFMDNKDIEKANATLDEVDALQVRPFGRITAARAARRLIQSKVVTRLLKSCIVQF